MFTSVMRNHQLTVFLVYSVLCVEHVKGNFDPRDRRPPASSDGTVDKVNAFSQSTSEEKYSIEEQLISLSNVTKASELLFKLGASGADYDGAGEKVGTPGTTGNIDRERQRPPRQSFTDQASCEPEMHTIDLSNYTNGIDDVGNNEIGVIFPRCIRVARCGGCCGPSNLLKCMPTKISMLDVRRALVKLTPAKRTRDATVLETIQVEQHEACSCQCREQESDCDARIHRYSPEKCKCICLDYSAQIACTHGEKWWDARHCACKCRNILHCSTGLSFNHHTCTCEVSTE